MCLCRKPSARDQICAQLDAELQRLSFEPERAAIIRPDLAVVYHSADYQPSEADARELSDFLAMSEQMCERLGDPAPTSFHCRGKQFVHAYVLGGRSVLRFETREAVDWDRVDEEVGRIQPRVEALLSECGEPK